MDHEDAKKLKPLYYCGECNYAICDKSHQYDDAIQHAKQVQPKYDTSSKAGTMKANKNLILTIDQLVCCLSLPMSVLHSEIEHRPLKFILEISRVLVRSCCALIYGGFLCDIIIGEIPSEIDIFIQDGFKLSDALDIVVKFASENALEMDLIELTDEFCKV